MAEKRDLLRPEQAIACIVGFARGDLESLPEEERVRVLVAAAIALVEIGIADIAAGDIEGALRGVDALYHDMKRVMPGRCVWVREQLSRDRPI